MLDDCRGVSWLGLKFAIYSKAFFRTSHIYIIIQEISVISCNGQNMSLPAVQPPHGAEDCFCISSVHCDGMRFTAS